MSPEFVHDFRNGISCIAGIILRINRKQESILAAQEELSQLFCELRLQLLRVLSALERSVDSFEEVHGGQNALKQSVRDHENLDRSS